MKLSAQEMIVKLINDALPQPLSTVQIQQGTFSEMGLDSEAAVAITGSLSDYYDIDIDPLVIFDCPTIDSLASHINDELAHV